MKNNKYERGNFLLRSNFEIREIREEDVNGDIDLFVPIDNRTVNLFIPFIDPCKMSRIQLSQIKSIVLRFNTGDHCHWCSVHFLNNIDLLSHVLNFEFDYKGYEINIIQEEYSVSFKVIDR